jgi:hypothetical protein
LHSSELLIVCGSRLFFDLCTTSPRLSKEDTAYFELEISAEIDRQQQTLFDPKVRAAFPALGVNFDFARNLLTFSQARKPRAFKGADVNKHIGSAIIWLDKAKTFRPVECNRVMVDLIFGSRVPIRRERRNPRLFAKCQEQVHEVKRSTDKQDPVSISSASTCRGSSGGCAILQTVRASYFLSRR